MKLGFTGTREGWTRRQAASVAKFLSENVGERPDEFHHGDCIGADASAHDLVRQQGNTFIVSHPPENSIIRAFKKPDVARKPKPYLVRNRAIVNETDTMLATPDGPERRQSGTWSTVRFAVRQGRQVTIIMPDGSVVKRPKSPAPSPATSQDQEQGEG